MRLLLAVPAACVVLLWMGVSYLGRWGECNHESMKYHAVSTGKDTVLSNGTHWFRPTLVVVSLDGFRADYIDRGVTPELVKLGKRGLRAEYMEPSFPTSTFPNHYTLVTGLYPGSHGIVSNTFYDTQLNSTFVYTDPARSSDPRWWDQAEPIWVTAERQGVRAGVNMWPGSTAVIRGHRPTYVEPYKSGVTPASKVDKVLEWLDLPLEKRPALLATYMPEVDGAAHKMGPNDESVNSAARMVDAALGHLWTEIERRNLTDIVNLMVVSDHGMAESHSGDNAIYIDDIVDTTRLRGIYCWPLGGLEPYDARDVPGMYAALKKASVDQPWTVYLRDQMPHRFHYTFATRIAPIFVVPDMPYYVTTRANDAFYATGKRGAPIGVHGYDNKHPLMRATFVALGPAFRPRDTEPPMSVHVMNNVDGQVVPEAPRVSNMDAVQDYLELVRSATVTVPHEADVRAWGDGSLTETQLRRIRHPPFSNVELYALMARILQVDPAPNNGTTEFSRWWLAPAHQTH
ncbi:hypothetical protein EV175_003527 [Coemansia sp. RSA 1933]|nr:hypothetical protein EV175_003527 [Coemansia sp. RSA 1933]